MKRLFATDLRSLAAFRIAIALLLLYDLIDRSRDLTAHYTDYGVMPRAALATVFHDPYGWTFHALGGSAAFAAILFTLAGLFAVLLLLGKWTRLASIASWIFLVSLQHRNAYVLYGGDLFLRLMVFWGMFLPWGRRFSLDAQKDAQIDRSRVSLNPEIASVATAAILLQVVFVYFFTGLLKAKDPSWQNGLGVYYALALDTYARPLGTWLLQFRGPVRALSYATLTFELAGPLLLLAAFRAPKLRMATIASFVVFQGGLAACLSLGLFPWISTAAILPFLPRDFWEKRRDELVSSQPPETDSLPAVARLVALACLITVFFWNLGTIIPLPFRNSPLWSAPRFLALNQGWVMFMSPKVNDGWYVIPGQLADGSQVDLFSWKDGVRWERPKSISARYKDLRWTKYMSSLWDYAALRPYFAWYLCDRWNRQSDAGRKLTKFEINYQLELTRPDLPNPPAERVSLGAYLCGSDLSF